MSPEHKAAMAEGRKRAAAERAARRQELRESYTAWLKTEGKLHAKVVMARGTDAYAQRVDDWRVVLAAMPQTLEDVA